MIQIILGLIIVAMGVFIFYKYPFKADIKQLTIGALLIVVAVVLNRISFMVPFLGFPSLEISLESIPLMLAGLVLAPTYGFMVGVIADGIGVLITGASGFPFLGFTINSILYVLIPCFSKMYIEGRNPNTINKVLKVVMCLLVVVASVYVLQIDTVTISKEVINVSFIQKVCIIALMVIVVTVLFITMFYIGGNLNEIQMGNFNIIVISVLLMELVVNFVLTPIWLQSMYSIPFWASFFVRVLRACVMIPVKIAIAYPLYNAIYQRASN
ncbi:MAG: folate family ECF transporter S component [Thomasclavelia sp.]|jgi:ECF transporter S component (folate family)|nr:folate family ECF transporter S component [Thomasclavelia sp.]